MILFADKFYCRRFAVYYNSNTLISSKLELESIICRLISTDKAEHKTIFKTTNRELKKE